MSVDAAARQGSKRVEILTTVINGGRISTLNGTSTGKVVAHQSVGGKMRTASEHNERAYTALKTLSPSDRIGCRKPVLLPVKTDLAWREESDGPRKQSILTLLLPTSP